jgi:dienelactone hydrolase
MFGISIGQLSTLACGTVRAAVLLGLLTSEVTARDNVRHSGADKQRSAKATLTSFAAGEDPWTLTQDIPLVSRWPDGVKMREDNVTADLYRPKGENLPAAVIINSSGGVLPQHELYYARLLASNGIAALVVDSFTPRGAHQTTDDQSRVWQEQSDADAAAGFRWLAAKPWVDSKRIVVIGMSRGGSAAIHMAVEFSRRRLMTTDALFAAHIAITPGGCNVQALDAKTTGAPIFFMLGELDNETPIQPCLEYIERVRAAGNSNVRLAVYPGVYHGFNWTGGIAQTIDDDFRRCSLFWKSPSIWIDRTSQKEVPVSYQWLMENCVDRMQPHKVGGDRRVEAQSSADLLQFLRDVGIIEDATANAIVPDCRTLPTGIHQYNCTRARAGWIGDLVGLARAYRYANGVPRDDAMAARLFRFAADRGHPRAQWELADMMRLGLGVPRNAAAALPLLHASAGAGEAPAMNILGLLARDGTARPRDDAEAVLWFRKAAALRHEYAFYNLGRMYWEGRGGLPKDHVEAVRLWRKSAFYDNPLGRLALAEALEKGDGTSANMKEALDLYGGVATQDREPDAKHRAADALTRLNSASR